MRHRIKRGRLNRFTSWRKATLKALFRSLLLNQSIRTTKGKALAVKPLADRMISLAKANTLAAKRRAYTVLGDHALVKLLFAEIGPRFAKRNGGYTRIINLIPRRGDNAPMAILEFTEIVKKDFPKKAKAKAAAVKDTGLKQPEAPQKDGGKLALEEPPKPAIAVKEKEKKRPPEKKKPKKNFLGGIRKIFKKERDSL
ncbi:50S ribosomal protein L17 [Candidatus Omnitrophota bacterium]